MSGRRSVWLSTTSDVLPSILPQGPCNCSRMTVKGFQKLLETVYFSVNYQEIFVKRWASIEIDWILDELYDLIGAAQATQWITRTLGETIVTFNLCDFPEAALAPWRTAAIHPQDYLRTLYGISPAVVLAKLAAIAKLTIRPLMFASGWRQETTGGPRSLKCCGQLHRSAWLKAAAPAAGAGRPLPGRCASKADRR